MTYWIDKMSNTNKVKIEYISLEDLQKWPRNPKDHDLGAIHQSMSRFGFVNPFIIDERTGKLVVGHGRLDILQQMKAGGQEPPERITIKDNLWLVPVVRGISFDSDLETEGYLIADNRLTELGGWREDKLSEVLSDLATQGKEMLNGIGFDDDDIDSLINKLNPLNREHITLTEEYAIVITDLTEQEQVELLQKLQNQGLKCKAYIS